jgi:hypothetical protein
LAAGLESDGTFRTLLPPGDYRVTVEPGLHLPEGWKEGEPLPPNQPEVPALYQSAQTTTLRVEVESGRGPLELPVLVLE